MKRTINGVEIEIPSQLVASVLEAETALEHQCEAVELGRRPNPAGFAELEAAFEVFARLDAVYESTAARSGPRRRTR